MKLYSYWRSSTSLRVRAVLNLKKFDYQIVPVDLLAGAHHHAEFEALTPSAGVPVLELDNGIVLTQSHAIIDYLEALRPTPALLPVDPLARAEQLAAAYCIAMDIHPVNNLRVLNYLRKELHQDPEAVTAYVNHWMHEGLSAFQTLIRRGSDFSFGKTLGLADICLVSQMVNARRWGLDMTPFGRLIEIDARAKENPAIKAAMPDHQPDAK